MKILVPDTSVLVDLERGDLLDACFRLPYEFAVPDLLYAREFEGFGGAELVARGLRVEELTGEEVMIARNVPGKRPLLSFTDAFAYALAASRGWILLTSDGELRALARAERVTFHGVLWVLDSLFDGEFVEATALVSGLEAIGAHPRCRLPRAETSKVGWNGRRSYVTGFQPARSGAVDHESALEQDFVTLTRFLDRGVAITSQPVTVAFRHDGRARRYTPDFLVRWGNGRSELVEVGDGYGPRRRAFAPGMGSNAKAGP